ncbi:B-cell receptor CD22-like, partial [Silurus asotus]
NIGLSAKDDTYAALDPADRKSDDVYHTLAVIKRALGNQWSVKYSQENLCAVKGSTVVMEATYTHPTDVTVINRFWFINPVKDVEATDLRNESGYSGRVEYLGDEQLHFSLRLSDVKKSDENMYSFKFRTTGGGYTGFPGITLRVTDLQLIAPAEVTEGESVILTCKTTCSLTDPTFIWYKNTHDLTTNTYKSNKLHLQRVSSEDAGSYNCAVRGSEHLPSPAQYLSVRYSPKNVFISSSGEKVERSSVTLTCSSDDNPPVETYTWFKENETSPVGSGQSYRALQSGLYYCEVQNKLGSERSAAVSITITTEPAHVLHPSSLQNVGMSVKDDTYAALDPADRKSDDVYHTLAISHPSPPDDTLTSDYCNKENVSISPSGEKVEGSSVNLTCSSDSNPPVENYTWFKQNEASPVGSGQSYRALQSGLYYCEVQNKLGSERSAAVSITITDGTVIVYVAVGLGLFGLAALLSVLFWMRWRRQRNNPDEGDYQNIGMSVKDDTYAALDPADRKSDDVYHTLAVSHPSPPDDMLTSDYCNKERPSSVDPFRQHLGGRVYQPPGGSAFAPLYRLSRLILLCSNKKLLSLEETYIPGRLNEVMKAVPSRRMLYAMRWHLFTVWCAQHQFNSVHCLVGSGLEFLQ